jgi:hypothetical protein
MDFKALSKKIGDNLKTVPSIWNSQSAVLELSAECYPMWEQSEWLDFYFNYLCEKHLPNVIPINEKVCGTTFFDGIKDFIPDFKESIAGKTKNGKAEQKESNIYSRDFDIAYKNYQHWRQMEWVESYFNYLCEKKLSGFMKIPGPSFHKFSFNALLEIPWIFKSYIENTGNKKIILADTDLITQGIIKFKKIGFILASGAVEYTRKEITGNKINGKVENNQDELIMEKEIRQHSVFRLKHIQFIPFSFEQIQKCETFQPGGFKNKEHLREKVLLNVSDAKNRSQFSLDFSE